MNRATTPQGEPMVVLTAQEYRDLTEDIGDAVLARAAAAADEGAPRMESALALRMLEEGLHPLTAWRKAAGLTQAALAARASIRAATLSDIESDRIDPRLSTMKALANALGVDIDDIAR